MTHRATAFSLLTGFPSDSGIDRYRRLRAGPVRLELLGSEQLRIAGQPLVVRAGPASAFKRADDPTTGRPALPGCG